MSLPSHTALILDGNGRWAERRGLPRWAGHRAGARAVERIVEAAFDLGLPNLTLYGFSSDNWRRAPEEVGRLFALIERTLVRQADEGGARDVRLSVLGRRDRLPASLVRTIERAEEQTAERRGLHLRVALDYSARAALRAACLEPAATGQAVPLGRGEELERRLAAALNAREPIPDVDLLVRTGGERRLSDFLLWECAYAELVFVDRLWPDFRPADLVEAVDDYAARERRFGTVPRVARPGSAPTYPTSSLLLEETR